MSLRQYRRDDDFHQFTLDGTLNDRVLKIDGEAGTWDALVSGTDVRFDAELVLDTLTIAARGHVDDVLEPRRPELEFRASGPDIDDVTRVLGLGAEGDGDVDLQGKLAAAADGPLELRVLGNIAGSSPTCRTSTPSISRCLRADRISAGSCVLRASTKYANRRS